MIENGIVLENKDNLVILHSDLYLMMEGLTRITFLKITLMLISTLLSHKLPLMEEFVSVLSLVQNYQELMLSKNQ